jgi:hypothetical protein
LPVATSPEVSLPEKFYRTVVCPHCTQRSRHSDALASGPAVCSGCGARLNLRPRSYWLTMAGIAAGSYWLLSVVGLSWFPLIAIILLPAAGLHYYLRARPQTFVRLSDAQEAGLLPEAKAGAAARFGPQSSRRALPSAASVQADD